MTSKKIVCYAKVLGDCSDRQSKEHYFSQGLFTNEMLTVSGQKWLKGQAKLLPKKTLGLRILCTSHNSFLSPLDSTAGKFFRILTEMLNNMVKRGNLPRSSLWRKDTYAIDGISFERWMTKYAVGVLFEEPETKWHLTDTSPEDPPEIIVKTIFGLTKLEYPMGLYFITGYGDKIYNDERTGCITLLHPDTKKYVGAMINFKNFEFLIWLCDEDLNKTTFTSSSGRVYGPNNNSPQYHLQTLNLHAKGKISGIININW